MWFYKTLKCKKIISNDNICFSLIPILPFFDFNVKIILYLQQQNCILCLLRKFKFYIKFRVNI
ncbi:hypothetical protein PFTANZ_04235 [Plasmodium falciparum Tanzania (2000708)]|uniref:Uncharacterized protein n=1 Tax=Plasmodium falciparum Tanzania (2000708) TaxID=1036725 RepID=A0A024W2Z4_PLAFA|nr:hypothetical protein PFTANZ_04235 [Plasmodium falciparum Tanzania (2000708)]